MAGWRVLVTLHNLVNIPPAACEEAPNRQFIVEARRVNQGDSGPSFQENPVSTFSSSEVTQVTPRVFEVRLDDPRRTQGSASPGRVWRCTHDVVDVVVDVTEGGELVGSSTTFQVDVRSVVEVTKLTTRIIGTEMGQVGISFSVDPADRAGYKRRLEDFLKRNNPRGLHLVQNVVDVVPEIDTFTKLYRKYNICDYDKRLRDFFTTYGPEYARDIPSLVKQWENREEELMRNLILDNGPELRDVDVHQRLTAFLTHYRLDRNSPSVAALVAEYEKDPSGLFAALASRYGAEPDPRNYLFPATHYPPSSVSGYPARAAPTQASTTPPRAPPAPGSGSLFSALKGSPPYRGPSSLPRASAARIGAPPEQRKGSGLNDSGNAAFLSLLGTTSPSPSAERRGGGLPDRGRTTPPRPGARVDPAGSKSRRGGGGFYKDAVLLDDPARGGATGRVRSPPSSQPLPPPHDARRSPSEAQGALHGGGEGPLSNSSTLWPRLMTMLRTSGRRYALEPGFFYYCSERTFTELVDCLDAFSKREREDLAAAWARLCGEALDVEPLDQTSADFDGALADAAHVAGLKSVQFQVNSIAAVRHREHYKLFKARLAAAKEKCTKSFALLGDERSLQSVARHGVGAMAKGEHSGAPSASGAGAPGQEPVAVFADRPFSCWRQPRSTWMLICDVVVGRCHTASPPPPLPHSGTRAFLGEYDSSAFVHGASGPSVAVYDTHQVLPRLLIQCTVDPTLAACPAHPSRPVEYYVVAENAVACSRCVVMGAYKGLDVLPIEEAATQARDRLAERRRAADALAESMSARSKQLGQEAEMMPTASRRLNALREVERLRREVEERVASIMAAVDRQDQEQAEQIRVGCEEAEAIRVAATNLSAELGGSLATAGPMAVVQALQRALQERGLESLIARACERIPGIAVEELHSLGDAVRRIAATAAGSHIHHSSGAAPPASGVPRPEQRRRGHPVGSLHDDTNRSTQATPLKVSPPKSRGPKESFHSLSDDMYSRYQSLSPSIEARETMRSRRPPAPHQQPSTGAGSRAYPPRKAADPIPRQQRDSSPARRQGSEQDRGAQRASAPATAASRGGGAASPREALTKGWALLHKGDEAGAAAEWRRVAETCGDRDAAGAKARAYLAEAVEKNYEGAARWYGRCLEIDPADRLTAYNYGVLLEALLRRPRDAIAMYDRAAALGDHVAAARAQQLRATCSTVRSSRD